MPLVLREAACDRNTAVEPATRASPPLTAASLGEQSVRPVSQYLAEPRYATADKENGERQANVCHTCHTLDEGGIGMVGPKRYAMFVKPAGFAPGYVYSTALQNAEFV